MTRRADRLDLLLAHRPKRGLEIEVAPYFNPALRKAAGNDVLILDVFDSKQLRALAQKDPSIPASRIGEIEDVDIVGDASQIGDLVTERGLAGKIGFVVSSHNFEHLPNPIRFLRGVESILKPGGVLSMAIPDCRATFDHFRSPTRLVDWLVAYQDGHSQPTAETIFDLRANEARFSSSVGGPGSCDWRRHDPNDVWLGGDLRKAYDTWQSLRGKQASYQDTHVSVVFDASFALLIEDLRHLGLIGLEIIEISQNCGHEFFAHLRRPVAPVTPETDEAYLARREKLLRDVIAGLGASAFPISKKGWLKTINPKQLTRRLIGTARYDRIRAWNRVRIGRRNT
jgi:SAM-dependent methyltransferase